ncbi:MAG: hypothetical protein OHK0057_37260 [Thermoflexibacter sp.]
MENVNPLPTTNAKKNTARVEEKPFLLKYENLHPQVKESFVYYDAENDFLHFSDPCIFEKVKMELTNKSHQELSAWENQFEGFTSLRGIYEQALQSEEERVKASNLLFGAELPKEVKRDTSHTVFVNKHRNSFVFDKEGIYKMNSGSISNGRTEQVVAFDTEYTNLGLSWYYLGSPTGRISYTVE